MLGIRTWGAVWKVQMNPLRYGGTPTVGNENEKKEIWNGLLVKGSKGAVVVAEWSLPTQEVFGSNPCIGKLNILLSTVLKRPK